MLRKLFGTGGSRDRKATGNIPPGERIYAVGDIHGRRDLLETLIAQIDADDAARPAARTTLIFLGDLVDRGPDSAGVVELLMQLERDRPGVRFLLGNHEEVFTKAVRGDRKAVPLLHRIGGRATALSYGITPQAYDDADYDTLLALLQRHVPQAHLEFLERFEDLIISGDYVFVHAGIRPGVPLANQRAGDLRWIRDEFLGARGTFEKIVVHGHTISEEVEDCGYRIGLDTGAYGSGRLTAMGFSDNARWVIQAVGAPAR